MQGFKRLLISFVVVGVIGILLTGNFTADTATAKISDGLKDAKQYGPEWIRGEINKSKKKGYTSEASARELEEFIKKMENKYGKGEKGAKFLTWSNTDKAATSGIRWRTLKYKVNPEKILYPYNVDSLGNNVGFDMKIYKFTEGKSNGMVTTRYFICKNEADDKLKNCSGSSASSRRYFSNIVPDKDGKFTVYLNAITQSYNAKSGTARSGELRSLTAWTKKESWGDPSSFKEHYNVPYDWHLDKISLNIHYIEKDSQTKKNIEGNILLRNDKATDLNAGSVVKFGNFINKKKYLKETIKDKEGNTWVLSQIYLMNDKDVRNRKLKQNQTFSVKGVLDAYAGKEDEVEIEKYDLVVSACFGTKFSSLNNVYAEESSIPYEKFQRMLSDRAFKLDLEDTHVYFGYEKVGDEDEPERPPSEGVPPDYKVRIQYEYQYFEDGEYVWKKAKSPEYLTDTKVFERTFADTLKEESRPYYGLYSIKAVNDKTKKEIKNQIEGSQSMVGDGDNPVYYDSARWKYYKALVESVKYEVPKDSSITITVRYAARLPYAQLMYTGVKQPDGKVTYKLVNSRVSTTEERHCPGEPITLTFPSVASDGTTYVYGYGSAGSIAGYGGEMENGWELDKLPIANSDTFSKTKLDLVCPEEPLYAVGVYGEVELPAVEPPPPPPTLIDPPEPNYEDDNYPTLTWNHHVGNDHVANGEDSTKGASEINQSFSCEIRTDVGRSDEFDVKQGIPSSEYEEIQANVDTYQTCGQIRQHDIKAWYYVTVSKLYYWYTSEPYTTTDTEGNQTIAYHQKRHEQTVSRTYKIDRYISYWTTDWFYVWHPKDLTIWNGSFPEPGYVTMEARSNPGSVTKVRNQSVGEFVHAKYDKNVYLGAEQGYPPNNVDWEGIAEEHVGQLRAQNDQTVFWNASGQKETILQDGLTTKPTPPNRPSEPGMTPDYVYYKNDIQIPPERRNDNYNSEAAVHYELASSFGIAEDCCEPHPNMNYGIPVNNVIVHTPVVNGFVIKKDNTYVQMISPTLEKQIVLDTKFTIDIPEEGHHLNIPAYGYKNYAKYVERWEVQFPIDVYSVDGSIFYPKNTWFEVDSGETNFLAASWNDEVPGLFKSRTIAINCLPNDKLLSQEDEANLRLENHVARNSENAEISGRIYGLNIFDVSDYPTWQSVFRVNNTYNKTGYIYRSGLANQNGVPLVGIGSKRTFPMVNGDHPKYSTMGVLSPGYNIRFSLTTVGNMEKSDDYVKIVPKFYYVNKKTGARQEADVYYDETINGKYQRLVQVGSPIDLNNKKALNVKEDVYNISKTILSETARLLGFNSVEQWTKDSKYVYTFGNIMIPSSMRTFYGSWHSTLTSDSPIYGKRLELPDGVAYQDKAESVQEWWCSYYLPASIHAVPKGYDVYSAAKQNGIDYKENFWLKDGYLIVNFDIYTLNGGKARLRYGETENCNMWDMEKKIKQKTDSSGKVFTFDDGDFVVFDLDHTALDDYTSGGTH